MTAPQPDPTGRLDPKVSAALLGGAVSTLIVWGLEFAVVNVPATVAAAVTTLATVAAGYFTSSK